MAESGCTQASSSIEPNALASSAFGARPRSPLRRCPRRWRSARCSDRTCAWFRSTAGTSKRRCVCTACAEAWLSSQLPHGPHTRPTLRVGTRLVPEGGRRVPRRPRAPRGSGRLDQHTVGDSLRELHWLGERVAEYDRHVVLMAGEAGSDRRRAIVAAFKRSSQFRAGRHQHGRQDCRAASLRSLLARRRLNSKLHGSDR
jgi:hypothetical protein